MARPSYHSLVFQFGEACESIGIFTTADLALEYAATHLHFCALTSGVGEHGEDLLARLQDALSRPGLALHVREAPGGGELWLDLKDDQGTQLQPAIFTVTEHRVDPGRTKSAGGHVKLVHPKHETKQ